MDTKENKNEEQSIENNDQQRGGIDTAGSEGTQAHNNNNEDKPVSDPPKLPSEREAEKEAP